MGRGEAAGRRVGAGGELAEIFISRLLL